MRPDFGRGADEGLRAHRLDRRPFVGREAALRDCVGRLQRPEHPARAVDAPALAAERVVRGRSMGVGRERPDADGCLRLGMALARAVQAPVQRERFVCTLPVDEEVRVGVRQAEMRGELRAVVRAAEDPHLRRSRPERVCGNAVVLGQCRPCLQVAYLLGEVVGRGMRVRVQRACRAHVATRRATDAQIDAPRRQRFEHAELLGHLQRAVVRQHHAGAADADARGARRYSRHQDLGRRADDRRQAVVLADPEARVAEALAVLREIEGVADRRAFTAAGDRDRLIEDREFHAGCVGSIHFTASGFSTGAMSRLTATASPSLRTSTHSSTSVALALIS